MPRQTRFERAAIQLDEQQRWVESCGSDRAGYIANYGDPGQPPLDADGEPRTFIIPVSEQRSWVFNRLKQVPGTNDRFFMPHSGNGGTAIYEADHARLIELQDTFVRLARQRRR